jgi:tyrosyl-tRNA synthetase
MSLPDTLIVPYFEYLTDTPDEELAKMSLQLENDSVNPMDLKKRLAYEITAAFHDVSTAAAAQENFERVVQRRDLPEEMPEFNFTLYLGDMYLFGPPEVLEEPAGAPLSKLPTLLHHAGLASSVTEAKRLLSQGAYELVSPSGETQKLSPAYPITSFQVGDVIRRGRRRFVRLVDLQSPYADPLSS